MSEKDILRGLQRTLAHNDQLLTHMQSERVTSEEKTREKALMDRIYAVAQQKGVHDVKKAALIVRPDINEEHTDEQIAQFIPPWMLKGQSPVEKPHTPATHIAVTEQLTRHAIALGLQWKKTVAKKGEQGTDRQQLEYQRAKREAIKAGADAQTIIDAVVSAPVD
jgi:hypothetical protein